MKKIIYNSTFILFLILVFTTVNTLAQHTKEERDAAKKKIKASKITSMKVIQYNYKFGKPEEDGTKLKYLEYDDEGNLMEEKTYDSYTGYESKIETYIYNNVKNEIEITISDANDMIQGKILEKYNSNGNIKEETDYDRYGDIKSRIVFEYGSSNNLLKETKYDINGNVTKITDYEYDKNLNLISKTFKRDSVNVTGKFTYKYDDTNNRIEEIEYTIDGAVKEKYIYAYEGKNRIEEVKKDADDKMVYKVSFKYEGSNKIERILYTSDGVTMALKINYKYDKNGNLMEELESDKAGEKKKVIIYDF